MKWMQRSRRHPSVNIWRVQHPLLNTSHMLYQKKQFVPARNRPLKKPCIPVS